MSCPGERSEAPATTSTRRVRRGLVFEGGGGKGAFAVGCMKALKERGLEFDAVAGTSAGGLCGFSRATDSVVGRRVASALQLMSHYLNSAKSRERR